MISQHLVLGIPWDLLSTYWLVRLYLASNFNFCLWNTLFLSFSFCYNCIICLLNGLIPGSRYAVQRSGNVLMSFNNKVCFCISRHPSYPHVGMVTVSFSCMYHYKFDSVLVLHPNIHKGVGPWNRYLSVGCLVLYLK